MSASPAITGYRRPVDTDALAQNFRVFADADCAHEPLYAALARAIAGDAAVPALVFEAPYSQRRPVLLFACVHDLLLAGTPHPLAAFYATVAGIDAVRTDVEHAFAVFSDFCTEYREPLVVALRERATQTNEVGRSAGLRLALGRLDAARPIALVDVGCSAGLNLLVDRFRYTYRDADGDAITIGPASTVELTSTIVGALPREAPMPTIAKRFGIDLAPLDVRDARDARWLRACVWPSELERHARLDGAIALAMQNRIDLLQGDANARLADVLARLDPTLRPVVFHSWSVSYFDRDAKETFGKAMRAMVRERGGVWISAEGPGVSPGLVAPPLGSDATTERREATVWHLTEARDGECESTAIARTHPHCRWIEALA